MRPCLVSSLCGFTRLTTSSLRMSAVSVRRYCSEQSAGSPGRWDLVSAVCVERPARIVRELRDLEARFSALQARREYEGSMFSDHETKLRAEAGGQKLDDDDELFRGKGATKQITTQDLEDLWQDEATKFQSTPRDNPVLDKDVRNVDRLLDTPLILLTRQRVGKESFWLLPQKTREEGETMRQTADRALASSCGSALNVLMLGNAPCGFYKYKYPAAVRQASGVEGAKVFFYRALHREGNLTPAKGKKGSEGDFQWLTRTEAAKTLFPQYFDSLDPILLMHPDS